MTAPDVRTPTRRLISVVVPVYSERDVLPETYRRTRAVLSRLDLDYEFVFVDDGSRDDSYEILADLARQDPRVRVLRLSRNFGQQIAVTAGLDHAAGDVVVVMDADLQDDPELIRQFLEQRQAGYDVVYHIRGRRLGMSLPKRVGTSIFYGLLRRFSSIRIPRNVGLFRLMDRRVVAAIREMRETNRFLPGLFAWAGFRQIGLPSDRPDRAGGKAKSLGKLVALGLDGIISFSNAPLRIALWLGIVVSGFAFLYGAFVLLQKLIRPAAQLHGWTSTVLVVLFLGGVQLIVTGIIGEYVGRLYDEVKRRPLYLISDSLNLEGRSFDSQNPARTGPNRDSGFAGVSGAEPRIPRDA
ncbi:MAG: glycosyltransferase family 2 protein [candidate division WOR-3 bacterium]